MVAEIIDGKAFAERLKLDVKQKIHAMQNEFSNFTVGLAVVLVGDDPASEVYVSHKEKACAAVGIESYVYRFDADMTQEDLTSFTQTLNNDPKVHGILVQLPLPEHLDSKMVIETIVPFKDVDGFSPINVGLLHTEDHAKALLPCTPFGSLCLLSSVRENLAGLHAVVIGRSHIVGRPMAELLLEMDCTVTITHSKTKNLPEICRQADIIVAAIGKPNFVKGDWIKQGALIIDVGINRIDIGDGKTKLVGDVDFEQAKLKAGAITPVPGGVGPMTVACLLRNAYQAASLQYLTGHQQIGEKKVRKQRIVEVMMKIGDLRMKR